MPPFHSLHQKLRIDDFFNLRDTMDKVSNFSVLYQVCKNKFEVQWHVMFGHTGETVFIYYTYLLPTWPEFNDVMYSNQKPADRHGLNYKV